MAQEVEGQESKQLIAQDTIDKFMDFMRQFQGIFVNFGPGNSVKTFLDSENAESDSTFNRVFPQATQEEDKLRCDERRAVARIFLSSLQPHFDGEKYGAWVAKKAKFIQLVDKKPRINLDDFQALFKQCGCEAGFVGVLDILQPGQTRYCLPVTNPEPQPEPQWNKSRIAASIFLPIAAFGVGIGVDSMHDFSFLKGNVVNSEIPHAAVLAVAALVYMAYGIYTSRPKSAVVAPQEDKSSPDTVSARTQSMA